MGRLFASIDMGKLTSIKPRLKALGSRIAAPSTRQEAEAQRHRERDRTMPWRAWYKTARWQKLRMVVLVRDLFTCQMKGCGRIEADTSQLVADHKIPHRGDEVLFWDENNLHCLCKTCHDSLKQKQERQSFRSW
ncbi:HNH endonuclease [Rhizobium rhizogenes]|uniref:HNH endonuclease n=1 Tax=Rhizobium rhizogenes TaxID=359 RepID=UPI0024BE7D99|nr:HNH endonuclease signature motif containing protein [Rhizobium rhizogenes]MDJ1632688.1 HNH endonuclease signature motif containing protein [Rhizobium rhizogenes]